MSLDSTVGTGTSNSYVSVAEADVYFLDRIGGDKWDDLDSKEPYLITASRMIDWNFDFIGVKTDENQSMEFPRTGLVLPNYKPPVTIALMSGYEILADVNSFSFPVDQIPPQVKQAAFELAFQSIDSDRLSDDSLGGISELQAGPLKIKATPAGSRSTKPWIIPPYIRLILKDMLDVGSIGVIRLMRA